MDGNSREWGRAPSVRDGERVVGSGMEGIWRASVIARNNNAGVIAYVWVEGSSDKKKNDMGKKVKREKKNRSIRSGWGRGGRNVFLGKKKKRRSFIRKRIPQLRNKPL